MKINSYYAIACNDIAYLEAVGDIGYYNQPTTLCQEIVEKLLKSVIEQVYIEDNVMDILRSHSLKTLGRALKTSLPQIELDIKDLTYLTNYYYDTRYPGPDYHLVSKDDYEECKRIMYDVKKEVDKVQKENP